MKIFNHQKLLNLYHRYPHVFLLIPIVLSLVSLIITTYFATSFWGMFANISKAALPERNISPQVQVRNIELTCDGQKVTLAQPVQRILSTICQYSMEGAPGIRPSFMPSGRPISSGGIYPSTIPSVSYQPIVSMPPITSGQPVAVVVSFYSSYEPYLLSGDMIIGNAIRGGAETPITDSRFNEAHNYLHPSSGVKPGIIKMIMFSSKADVAAYINKVNSDVLYIGINMEREMTPASEFTDIYVTVAGFADIVHNNGRKAMFVPIRATWDQLENSGQLASVLNAVDMVDYQWQKEVPDDSKVKAKYTLFKSLKPSLEVMVQVFAPTNTSDQMISGFQQINGYFDRAGIFTFSSGSVNTTVTALQAFRS